MAVKGVIFDVFPFLTPLTSFLSPYIPMMPQMYRGALRVKTSVANRIAGAVNICFAVR